MINKIDLRVGNWISLNYPGCLIAAFKVLEEVEDGVFIEDDSLPTMIMDKKYPYINEEPERVRKNFYDIKGIPLTTTILESCGFQIKNNLPVKSQPGTEAAIANYYSSKDLFTICYKPKTQYEFTYETSKLNLEFVHQLQNLYFDLTKKELEITIPTYNFQFSSSL